MGILVTGGAGYIGSHTAKLLAVAGHQPVIFDDMSQGHGWAVKWGPLERGSLSDTARLAEVFASRKVEAVVHFAANALVGESMTNPTKYFDHLGTGTPSQAINLGTGRGHSVREVVETVARVSGRAVPAVQSARRPGDPPELVAAPARAREVLGWTCQYADLETIVRHAWAWHDRHR